LLITVSAFAEGRAQAPSPPAALSGGIAQARAGDFLGALLTLGDVVNELAARPAESASLARAHAYRAVAYLGLNQSERARASVRLALAANPGIAVEADEFGPAIVALFAETRQPVAGNPEARGQAAEQAGRWQEAFLAYLNAFQALPASPAAADDQRLREKIITAVSHLDSKPLIPDEARAHLKKADDLVAAEALLGGSGSNATQQAAAAELRQAVRSAPWWGDATFMLATVLQKLQRVDEALLNLNLYRLADPQGYAAAAARTAPKNATEAAAAAAPAPVAPATIHVYWQHTVRSLGMKPKLLCDGHHVADLENGRFIVLNTAPGFHVIEFQGRKVSSTFEGGRTSYVRASIGGYPAHFSLNLVNPDQAPAEIRDKKITPNDAARTFSAECAGTAPRK
jgi:tetratricopeptide (TPR) repeat protein